METSTFSASFTVRSTLRGISSEIPFRQHVPNAKRHEGERPVKRHDPEGTPQEERSGRQRPGKVRVVDDKSGDDEEQVDSITAAFRPHPGKQTTPRWQSLGLHLRVREHNAARSEAAKALNIGKPRVACDCRHVRYPELRTGPRALPRRGKRITWRPQNETGS